MIDRNDILHRMQQVMGELPPATRKPAPQWKLISESRDESLIRRKIHVAVEHDSAGNVTDWCPAWWLIPVARENTRPGPAVVCLHQTIKIAKDETVGLGGSPNLHYAIELARRGFVTLSPDYPRFGEYPTDPYALGYGSATLKALWNHLICVDMLTTTAQVDPARLGCIGHSLGAHNALFLGAFELRMKATVSSCGFNPWSWNDEEGRGKPGDLADWSHPGYMPRIKTVYHDRAENMPFDFDEVLSIIAPRSLFINAPEKDFFLVGGVRECIAKVSPKFPKGHLEVRYPDCQHDFPPEVREAAYAFLEQAL